MIRSLGHFFRYSDVSQTPETLRDLLFVNFVHVIRVRFVNSAARNPQDSLTCIPQRTIHQKR